MVLAGLQLPLTLVGIAATIVSGIILKKTKLFAGDPAPFVMELPAYHIPSVKGVLIHMWDRSKAFVRKAGTIIFLSSALIWFLSNFNFSLQMVETPDSILASIGRVIAPIFAPLGWGHWEAAVGQLCWSGGKRKPGKRYGNPLWLC